MSVHAGKGLASIVCGHAQHGQPTVKAERLLRLTRRSLVVMRQYVICWQTIKLDRKKSPVGANGEKSTSEVDFQNKVDFALGHFDQIIPIRKSRITNYIARFSNGAQSNDGALREGS